jgi:hypothetical protein
MRDFFWGGNLLDSALRFDIVHKSEFKGQPSELRIPDAWE